jgi:hypothetical protein
MRGRLAAVVLSLAAAGCAGTPDLAGRPPPSLERAIAALRADPGCATSYEAQPGRFLEKGDVVARCPAAFPTELQQAGVTGACLSIMDITPDGRVANLESRCNADLSYNDFGSYDKEWLTFAQALFQASTDRSFEDYRLAPDAIDPGERRTDLSAVTYFVFEGEAKPEWLLPERFERKQAN